MKKTFILLVALLILMSIGYISVYASPSDIWDGTVASGFESGTGTENDPYIIKTPEQLAYLAYQVNSGTTYEGKFIKLTNDICLNDTTNWENWGTTAPTNSWTAIGTDISESFRGIFDGDGHEISGIYINTELDYQGLFGYINSGTVKNVGVINSCINVDGGDCVGGVVGRNYNGTVSNSYNIGTVSGTNCVGGVVGENQAFNNGTATVNDCYNTGYVSGNGLVGGVVGYKYFVEVGTVTVSNCYNTGDVLGVSCVGGVVGGGRATNCYNTGNISGTKEVGGIVGSGGATNSYNTGDVSGVSYVGGVAGNSNNSIVSNCYNKGAVTGTDERVGGVIGHSSSYGTISYCYNIGDVCCTGNYTGGVVGSVIDGKISNSYNIGNVVGTDDFVGGVVGSINSGSVINCYNNSLVSGKSFVGGVVGNNYYNSGVSNCYNIGICSGSSFVGSVVGYNYHTSTIHNSYYLVGCAKDGNNTVQFGTGNSTIGFTSADISGQTTGLRDAQIKQEIFFVGFDFEKQWEIAQNINNGSPYLKDVPAQITGITVLIDGKEVQFDVPPTIIEGRTLVPLRAIFEALGATVEWDGTTKTVTGTRGSTVIIMTVGQTTFTVNGEVKTLDVPSQIIDGRTLVPTRAIAESFGINVVWNAEERAVYIG